MSNKADSNSLILGTRNTYRQVLAPDFLKSHFGAKRVGNYYYYVFVNQSKLYLFVISAKICIRILVISLCVQEMKNVENRCSKPCRYCLESQLG